MTTPVATRPSAIFHETPTSERLVIEGYRRWSMVEAHGGAFEWKRAVDLYTTAFGVADGARALAELAGFVTTLKRCAACPLATLALEDERMSREETLVVGLVASIQHGDDEGMRLCLDALSCRARCLEVAAAAGRFALTLKAGRHVLVPISRATIEACLIDSKAATCH